MSGKTSADEWEMSADKWRWVKTNARPVQMSKDESKTNERRVQKSEDEWETSENEWETSEDEWETSAILSFMNPESPTVFYFRKNM